VSAYVGSSKNLKDLKEPDSIEMIKVLLYRFTWCTRNRTLRKRTEFDPCGFFI